MSYDIRDARADELQFVYSAWKQSLRNSKEWAERPTAAAFAHLNPHVNRLVDQSAVLVAAQGQKLLGFVAFEAVDRDVELHYIYVKHAIRRAGVGRALLLAALEAVPGAEGVYYTQTTDRFDDVAVRYGMELRKP